MADLERRHLAGEIRAAGRKLIGYAATFGTAADIGGFSETVRSGAFAASLRAKPDILALVDHDPSKLLARTRSGTLRLEEDRRGLQFELDVPGTTLGNDVLAMAERGDLGGMSFGFRVTDEAWPDQRTRELRAVELVEISVVHAFPAYDGTSVAARARIAGLQSLSPAQRRRLGLFARIFGRSAEPVEGSPVAVASPPPPPARCRRTAPPCHLGAINGRSHGATPAPRTFATVCACIDVIASAIATLPPLVYEVMSDGSRREAPGHPVARLLAAPNSLQSWPDLVRCFMGSVLLTGNAVVVIDRDGAGQASALYPLPWYAVQPILVPTSVGQPSSPIIPNSRLAFDVTWTLSPFPLKGAHPASGFPARYWSDDGETFFLRERSTNGILGSRVWRARPSCCGRPSRCRNSPRTCGTTSAPPTWR